MPVNAKQQDNIAANSQKDITFIPDGDITGTEPGSREKILHANALIWYPAETDVSIRPGWFYHTSQDEKVKTPEQLLDIYYSSVGRNSVLLMNIPPDKNGLVNEHDIRHLQEWKRLRDQTFKTNLAKGAVTTPGSKTEASRLTDNNTATSVTVKGTDSTGTIEFTLPAPATFDVLSLQENIRIGQRIEKFVLEYADGNGWHEVVRGTTVGYKRLLRFDPVTAGKVRLKILSSRQPPALAEFGLYKQAQ
jgi:alpha-L-fucosidase